MKIQKKKNFFLGGGGELGWGGGGGVGLGGGPVGRVRLDVNEELKCL